MPASSWRIAALVLGLLALNLGLGQSLYGSSMQVRQRTIVEAITSKLQWARQVRRPAILLGGGSNALTGLQASLLSEILQRPAYNLALVAEGDDYHNALTLLEASALDGDTVIYASRGFHRPPSMLEHPISTQSNGIDILVAKTDGVIPRGSILRELVTYTTTVGAWNRPENYNKFGDFTPCLGPKHIMPEPLPEATVDRDQYVRDLADFSARLRKRHIRVLFLAPDIYVRDEDVPHWVAMQQNFHAELGRAGLELLHAPDEHNYVTDASEFCGSSLHPSPRHASLKTKWLAQQLVGQP